MTVEDFGLTVFPKETMEIIAANIDEEYTISYEDYWAQLREHPSIYLIEELKRIVTTQWQVRNPPV